MVGLTAFLVLFHIAGGWYFASQIRSDALLVEEQSFDYTIPVLAWNETTVTLDGGADPSDDLLSNELMGIAFADGYGQAGNVVDIDGSSITRTYTHLSGEALEAGDLVELEGFAYPATPAALGIDYSNVMYSSSFGEFPAWFVDGDSSTWAIFVHGRGAHMGEGLRILPTLSDAGMPVMLISYRNDEASPQTDDRLGRFGATEWEDLDGAVSYALDNGADRVVLVGFSMGSAISMAFLERSPLADSVAAVIFDAPALDLAGMVEARAADTDLVPGLPMTVPRSLTVAAKAFADVQFDVTWWLVDYLSHPMVIDVPTLLIHGEEDGSVPVDQSIDFAESLGDLAQLELFPDAGHVRSWNVDRERYEGLVAQFLSDLEL
jgi:pimeloyl-ACP methyl ester carboxylesterase